MTKTSFIAAAALALVASTSAFAGEATYEYPQATVSKLTRAEVTAQVLQARAAGVKVDVEGVDRPETSFASVRSRDDVRAETRAATARGETRAIERQG